MVSLGQVVQPSPGCFFFLRDWLTTKSIRSSLSKSLRVRECNKLDWNSYPALRYPFLHGASIYIYFCSKKQVTLKEIVNILTSITTQFTELFPTNDTCININKFTWNWNQNIRSVYIFTHKNNYHFRVYNTHLLEIIKKKNAQNNKGQRFRLHACRLDPSLSSLRKAQKCLYGLVGDPTLRSVPLRRNVATLSLFPLQVFKQVTFLNSICLDLHSHDPPLRVTDRLILISFVCHC